MLNQFTVQGKIATDLELKESKNGKKYMQFDLQCNRTKEKGKADFFKMTSFGNTAEMMSNYLSKGREIIVQGFIRKNSYQVDGKNKSKLELIVSNINFVSSAAPKEEKQQAEQQKFSDDDELPF